MVEGDLFGSIGDVYNVKRNVLARLNAAPEPEKVETALTLSEPPKADAARYDSLRADHAAQEDHHV